MGLVAVSGVTWLGFRFQLNLTSTSFLSLAVVLGVALRSGFWEATAVSVAANALLLYFVVPPVFSWSIADPQNWVALCVFELVALLVSRLSAKAQQQAELAIKERYDVERLYELSRALLLVDQGASAGPQIVALIKQIFAADGVTLFSPAVGGLDSAGCHGKESQNKTREAFFGDIDSADGKSETWIQVLRSGTRPIGALAVSGPGICGPALGALASLTAIALEHAHSFERESRAEAERQTEKLRTAVLDSLAHDFKTPLTVIRAACGGLLSIQKLTGIEKELALLINRETDRLNELTTRVLQMARLDKGEVRLRLEPVDVEDVVQTVLSDLKSRLSRHSVRVDSSETVEVSADRELIQMALSQLLDNAAKYSPAGSSITVGVRHGQAGIEIAVHNFGPPIPEDFTDKIFERFFRAPGVEGVADGTGIGLSITKKVMEAHRGRVTVESTPASGNTFIMWLPAGINNLAWSRSH